MTRCPRCHKEVLPAGYIGDAFDPCMCAYTHLIPMPVANITEQRIREIVRDEIERAKGAAK